jgi:hypothetical protein
MLVFDHSGKQIQKQFENMLARVDQFIWPAAKTLDIESKSFFVFKPYPKQLRRNQIEQWASLQCTALSPFVNGDSYHYLSKAGLHLWVCQNRFHGIPETAMQMVLADGEHVIAGKNMRYHQTWHSGLLIACDTVPNDAIEKTLNAAEPLRIDKRKPWAVNRQIEQQLKMPSVWLAIVCFVSLCVAVWQGAAYATLSVQQMNAGKDISELQDTLGEQLAQQSQLQSQQEGLLLLQRWHSKFGFLPETLAALASKINQQGEWEANVITWQNRTMTLEISASNLDIASLVNELEQSRSLTQINIRPHAKENTWVLEASVK